MGHVKEKTSYCFLSMNKIILMPSRMCFCVWVGLWSSVSALDMQLCQLEHHKGARFYNTSCPGVCLCWLSQSKGVHSFCVCMCLCVLVCQGACMWRPRMDIWCLLLLLTLLLCFDIRSLPESASHWLTGLAGQQVPEIVLSPLHSRGILGACHHTFLHGIWEISGPYAFTASTLTIEPSSKFQCAPFDQMLWTIHKKRTLGDICKKLFKGIPGGDEYSMCNPMYLLIWYSFSQTTSQLNGWDQLTRFWKLHSFAMITSFQRCDLIKRNISMVQFLLEISSWQGRGVWLVKVNDRYDCDLQDSRARIRHLILFLRALRALQYMEGNFSSGHH